MMLKFSVYTTLLFLFSAMTAVGYWLWFPYNPIDIKEPLVVSPKIYRVGDRLGLTLDYCSHIAVPVTTLAKFILTGPTTDHVIDSGIEKTTVSKVGCNKVVSNTFVILSNFIPGTYHLEITAIYHVNPLRDIPVEINSAEFNIIK